MAKRRLNITGSYNEDDRELMLVQAEAVILDYLARPLDAAWTAEMASWTEDTVPEYVRLAILLQFGELNRFRGDDDGPKRDPGFLTDSVRAFLIRTRMPVIA